MKKEFNEENTGYNKHYGGSAMVHSTFALRGCLYYNDIKPPFRIDIIFTDYSLAKKEYDKLIERFDRAVISIYKESTQQHDVCC